MRRGALALAIAALAIASCFEEHSFNCGSDDGRCDKGERCLGGHCALRDDKCMTKYHYAGSAGPGLAGQCLGSVPDGGVACVMVGDPCDDGNPCTVNDTCAMDMNAMLICAGKPMDCGPSTCSAGMETDLACKAGACVPSMKKCDPYSCAGSTCAHTCVNFTDCGPGFYCVSGSCLSCGDFVSSAGYSPGFSTPAPVPGLAMNGTAENGPLLLADRLSLYFDSDRAGGLGGRDLYLATRKTADSKVAFGAAQDVMMLNSPKDDVDLATGDGMQFFFASNRNGNFDLFQATLSGGSFGAPAPVTGGTMAGPINTAAREAHPSLTADGKRLYFETDRNSPMLAPFGDLVRQVYSATRAGTQVPFDAAAAVGGLEPLKLQMAPVTVAWSSPSVMPNGGALFLINAGVPSRTEVAVAHIDPMTGQATAPVAILPNVDLAGGDRVSVSSDGCYLLMQSRKDDPAGDVVWSYRNGLTACTGAICGTDDFCCPQSCTGVSDADCPYPRTNLVTELYSMTDKKHDYLIAGETPKPGYLSTGKGFRVYADPLPNAVALSRFVSMGCDGKRYTYIGTEDMRQDYSLERRLGYVYLSIPSHGGARLYRARKEMGTCDEQFVFDQNECNSLQTSGYTCETSVKLFGVKP